jgi:GNAT superfamily N-acetyltransferase
LITRFAGYELDDEPIRVDRDAVWSFLTRQAYWGRWRTRQDVERQLDSAWRLVGVYEAGRGGLMVGFSRAISDGVAYAYLADLYVELTARSQGLGRELVRVMIDCGPGAGFRWSLHTADAHGLYEQFGFARPDHTYLERPARQPAGPLRG